MLNVGLRLQVGSKVKSQKSFNFKGDELLPFGTFNNTKKEIYIFSQGVFEERKLPGQISSKVQLS